jgi:ABC-type antimicrobial peptide transport system permease subunit
MSCSPLTRISETARGKTIQSSYTNYYDVVVSEALRAASSISTTSALQSTTVTRNHATGYVHVRSSLAKIRAQVRKLSPFFFSSYAPTASRAPLILRMQDYARMLDDSTRDLAMLRDTPSPSIGTFPDNPLDDTAPRVPKFRLLVKMTDQAVKSEDKRQYVVNSIRSAVGSDLVVVQQTAAVLEAANVAVTGLDAFFAFTSTLCLILTFFASWLAFSANVRESQHEFAILRSMLPATTVARCFIHEALSVTMSACILGVLVGLAIATSLVFQFSAFVESAIIIAIPKALIGSFVLSVGIIAIAASLEPSLLLMKATIASLLKGRADVL